MHNILTIADALSAIIAALALLVFSLKFTIKRCKLKRLDCFLMKIHTKIIYILIMTGILHGILSFRAITIANPAVYIIGFICLFSIIGAVITWFKRKSLKGKWILSPNILFL